MKENVVCKLWEGGGTPRPPTHQMDGENKATTKKKKKKTSSEFWFWEVVCIPVCIQMLETGRLK